MLIRLLLIFSILATANVLAASTACDKAMTQIEITECAVQAYKTADVELNEVYNKITAILKEKQKEKLKVAEMAWIKFRDANCEHQAFDTLGGSLYATVRNECLKTVTMARTAELKSIYPNLFTGQTTVTPQPAGKMTILPTTGKAKPENDGQVTAQTLIGNWATLESGYNLEIRFSVENGQAKFASFLNNSPFESGSWQLTNGQLSIISPKGERIHLYDQVIFKEGVLTLHEQDSSAERYKKIK